MKNSSTTQNTMLPRIFADDGGSLARSTPPGAVKRDSVRSTMMAARTARVRSTRAITQPISSSRNAPRILGRYWAARSTSCARALPKAIPQLLRTCIAGSPLWFKRSVYFNPQRASLCCTAFSLASGYGRRHHVRRNWPCGWRLKTLAFPEIAPLPQGQFAQLYVAAAHALEPGYLQSDKFTHAADLAFFALAQN